MNILVTGGAGFIGSALANRLKANHNIIAIDNLSAGNWDRLDPGIQKIDADLQNLAFNSLVELLKTVDIVCHLAAVKLHNEENSVERIENSNLLASQKLAIAAGLAGVRKVLFTSSLYAYGNKGPGISSESDALLPYNDYGRSKKIGEELFAHYANEFGFELVIARPYFIYGPSQYARGGYKSVISTNIERYHEGLPLVVVGSGQQQMDFVFIDDCIDALELMLEPTVQGVFNIASQESVSILEIMDFINSEKKCTLKFVDSDWTENTIRAGNSQKLRTTLGWSPKYSISQGISKLTEPK